MIIKKFAGGGGIVYLPTTNRIADETAKTTVSSSDSTTKRVDKLLDLVKEKGLDSDVEKFTNAVLVRLQSGMVPGGEQLSSQDLVELAQMASAVSTNYERFKKAEDNVTKQNAESDIAIDDRGRIYCYNDETNTVSAVDRETLKENPENYKCLTNAELLNLRRRMSSLAYDTKIIDDINNSVGIDTITKYLQDTVAKFKPSVIEGYSEKQKADIQSGLQALVGGNIDQKTLAAIIAGPDGVYKIKNSETIVDQHIPEALNYLISTLPNKMKNKLTAMSLVDGYDPKALMVTMLSANVGREFAADYEGSIVNGKYTGKKAASEKESSQQYKDDSLAARFARGDLKQMRAFVAPAAEMAGDTALMAIDA